jgi:hypothetical protein
LSSLLIVHKNGKKNCYGGRTNVLSEHVSRVDFKLLLTVLKTIFHQTSPIHFYPFIQFNLFIETNMIDVLITCNNITRDYLCKHNTSFKIINNFDIFQQFSKQKMVSTNLVLSVMKITIRKNISPVLSEQIFSETQN